jgi:hypothetical protein
MGASHFLPCGGIHKKERTSLKIRAFNGRHLSLQYSYSTVDVQRFMIDITDENILYFSETSAKFRYREIFFTTSNTFPIEHIKLKLLLLRKLYRNFDVRNFLQNFATLRQIYATFHEIAKFWRNFVSTLEPEF